VVIYNDHPKYTAGTRDSKGNRELTSCLSKHKGLNRSKIDQPARDRSVGLLCTRSLSETLEMFK
jgi:hypothetical protein